MIKHYWLHLLRTPKWLWILLLLAALIRLWIARLEIYVVALLLSLVLVGLTWFFAAALADGAHLSSRGKERFTVMTSLVAASPPLYAIVEECNVIFAASLIIVLMLLFYAYQIMQRWLSQQGSNKSMGKHILTQLFQLTSPALLFGIAGSLIGYYNDTLIIVLPFLLAAIFTIPYMITQYKYELSPQGQTARGRSQITLVIHIFFLVLLSLYFISHLYSYITAHMLLPF